MKLLIPSSHGEYAWHSLTQSYGLYTINEADPDGVEIRPNFHPEYEHWCEEVNRWDGHLYIRGFHSDEFLQVWQSEDGGIWAVEASDIWDHEYRSYTPLSDFISRHWQCVEDKGVVQIKRHCQNYHEVTDWLIAYGINFTVVVQGEALWIQIQTMSKLDS